MRDHTSNSALILFFFFLRRTPAKVFRIHNICGQVQVLSKPSFFSNFISPTSFIVAHICGSFFLKIIFTGQNFIHFN